MQALPLPGVLGLWPATPGVPQYGLYAAACRLGFRDHPSWQGMREASAAADQPRGLDVIQPVCCCTRGQDSSVVYPAVSEDRLNGIVSIDPG